jgi:hypothetical protein
MRRLEFRVTVLVEPERDSGSFDEDGTPNQVRVLHHQSNGFLLRLWQRALLEDRAARADEVEEPIGIDVLLQELAGRGFLVDVDLVNIDAGRVQKTSGVLAGGSGGLRVESRFRHPHRIIEMAV